MADRLVRNSSSPRVDLFPGNNRKTTIEPILPALLRGVIFLSVLAAPFVAALLAG